MGLTSEAEMYLFRAANVSFFQSTLCMCVMYLTSFDGLF